VAAYSAALGLVVLAAAAAAVARESRAGSPAGAYEVRVVSADGMRWTEWIAPSGQWRMQDASGEAKVFDGRRYAAFSPSRGWYVREGSAAFLGYLMASPVSRSAVAAARGQRVGGQAPRPLSGKGVYSVQSGHHMFRVTVLRGLDRETVARRGLFGVPARTASIRARERPLGARPTLPVRAYWFGSAVAGRRATFTMEYSRRLTDSERAAGLSPRKETTAYVVFYELPSAGGHTSAEPGRNPPAGELQIVSQPIESPVAQAAIDAFNGKNGEESYPPFERFEVTLGGGERGTVYLDTADGVQPVSTGGTAFTTFSIATPTTLVSVTGTLTRGEVQALAVQLEAIS
jgi:hypothetical protein